MMGYGLTDCRSAAASAPQRVSKIPCCLSRAIFGLVWCAGRHVFEMYYLGSVSHLRLVRRRSYFEHWDRAVAEVKPFAFVLGTGTDRIAIRERESERY